jgi:hypothetical protein
MKVAPELNLYVEFPFLHWIEVQQQHYSCQFSMWERGAAGFLPALEMAQRLMQFF